MCIESRFRRFAIFFLASTTGLVACRPADAIPADSGETPKAVAVEAWMVDASSEYFDYLATETRTLVSQDPHALGRNVCSDLGGRLQELAHRGDRFGPNFVLCAFEEPGMREIVIVGQIVQR